MRCAAFNTGPEFHMLDHIAPLAALMQMPLITTEEKNYHLACKYYPQVATYFLPDLEFRLGEITEQFDVLFECKYWGAHLKQLFQDLYQKKMRLVFCPHGQSDKGFQAPVLAQYIQQDLVLLYGDLLIDMLKSLNLWSLISHYAIVGNYRFKFYQKHKAFYDSFTRNIIPLDPKKKTLLYAPTWKDKDGSTSFFEYGPKVLSEHPSDWNLIIKMHPLLEQKNPAQFHKTLAWVDKKPNAFLIHDFPPVYPILSLADVYLGDFSSVGYDFLAFQKPLCFFPINQTGKLHECGRIIDPTQNLYLQIDQLSVHKEQNTLFSYAFAEEQNVKENILNSLIHSQEIES
jgi:hypothetical protein